MNGNFSAFAENVKSANMVYMLMCYKNRAYIFGGRANCTKRRADRTRADARIDKKLGLSVAHKRTIAA